MSSTLETTLPHDTAGNTSSLIHVQTTETLQSNASERASPGKNASTTLPTVFFNGTTSSPNEDTRSGISSGLVVSIVIIVAILSVVIIAVLITCFKKRGKFQFPNCSSRCCWEYVKGRKRSSVSSHGPLNEDDNTSVDYPGRELFAIGDRERGDLDGGEDGRMRSRRNVDADDDYYYDEIFGSNEFVDERTNASNKDLTMDDMTSLDFEV